MGSIGAYIFAFFGAIFAVLTSREALQWDGIILAWPLLVAAIIAFFAWRASQGTTRYEMSPDAKKVWTWSSAGEGIGIFLGINIAANLGHPELRLPQIALVVGLHFLPMGWLFPFRPFLILGLLLSGIALVGLFLPEPTGILVAGFGAALGLWTAAILAIVRQAKRVG
jgi:hypothetical protein